jgi:DNA-binding NtrC family response regulator
VNGGPNPRIFGEQCGKSPTRAVKTIPGPVWSRLGAYDWPGNVRELRNVVERGVLLADGPEFPERWLHLGDGAAPSGSPGLETAETVGDRLCLPLDGEMTLDEVERLILREALRRNSDNVSLTARVLGTTRERLRYRVQKYGLKTSD